MNAGVVTAYGAALEGGFEGTYEEFCLWEASVAENSEAASDAAEAASDAAEAASDAAEAATTAAETINNKQDLLTWDNAPTENSTNPVTSGGVKTAIDSQIPLWVNMGTISSLPVTKSSAAITADMICTAYQLGNPYVQSNDWTVTTAAGSVTVSGTINGSTTLRLLLENINSI